MGEGRGGLTLPLALNLIKVFNVIEAKKKVEQRSDLLHFNWINLIANTTLKAH